MKARPVVVILGAGFAGLQACEALASAAVEVLVIDRHNYNTFQPLLYQVATAGLSPGDIAYPLRSYARRHLHAGFERAVVTGVDFGGRRVILEDQDPVRYDYLVVATGAATNFFGVRGAAEHAHAIYTMEDAITVRDLSAESLEQAAAGRSGQGGLTIVIVGGGATGVEMAGTLAELRDMRLRTLYPEIDPTVARVVLIEQQDRLLSAFDKRLGAYALRVLSRRGVEVRCATVVSEVTPCEVKLACGEVISTSLAIWAAGVGPTPLVRSLGASDAAVGLERGRLSVGPDLRLEGQEVVFAVGDVSAARGAGSAQLLAQLAQPAIQEGRHAAAQIDHLLKGEPTESFVYKDKGTMATIGRRAAVAELPGGLRLRGTLAWVAWLGLHLVFLLGARNRVSVVVNWTWRYLYWRNAPKIIAGS
ncbi:MAG: NAD(P)/FAD-dependent oxidoreductase [Acidimicrobiales bacterium]